MNSLMTLSPQEQRQIEVTAMQMAERQKAIVQARYMVALHRPRDMEKVRSSMLASCKRPGFAEAALYGVPRGKRDVELPGGKRIKVTNMVLGPSIRFAEEALRAMKNIDVDDLVLSDDQDAITIKVWATDLEANVSHSKTFTVRKLVERKYLREGQRPVSSRTNSYGDVVYLVGASDDEVAERIEAQRSKAIRACVLRLVPADLLEECMAVVHDTIQGAAARQPGRIGKLVEAFAELGVKVFDLEEIIGCKLDQMKPSQYAELRAHYAYLRDHRGVADDATAPVREQPQQDPPATSPDAVDDDEPDWMASSSAPADVSQGIREQPRIGKHGDTEWHEWRQDGEAWVGDYSHHGEPGAVQYSPSQVMGLFTGSLDDLDDEQRMLADAARWAFTADPPEPKGGNERAKAALRKRQGKA